MDIKTNKHNCLINQLCVLLMLIFFYGISLAQAEEWIYKVRNGDNLWNLTVDYLIDISYVKQVQKLNNIADPWYILPGTKIRIPSEWVRHYPALVRVQNLQGTAQILEDEAKHPHQLKVGDVVMLGDTILTDADSTLILGFLDGSRILLQENSHLKIDHLMLLENTGMSDSKLQLLSGRLETQVAPDKGTARRFQIKTPVTVTSVRGTDYRISAEEKKSESKTEVVEGKVVVKGNRKSRLLTAGYGTITIKDQEPIPPVKLLPSPDISHIPVPFAQVPIQFSMPAHKDGKGYRVQIAKTDLFQDVLFDKPLYSSIIRGPDLPDGDYFLRVRGIDTLQLEGYNAQRPIIINARPEPPFLLSPKPGGGILLEDNLEFSWSRQQEGSQYHLQISNSQDFSELLIDAANVDDNELTVTKKLALGKYFWRVAAIDQDGDGPFSDGQLFRRIAPAPELEAPDITDDTLAIRSRSGLPGQTYHFQMSDDESFSDLLVDKYSDEPGFEIPRPGGGEYFIRVRTIDPDGFVGPFGTPQSIDVPYNYYWLLTLLPLLALLAL
jgi:hypothetical protein